MAKIERFEDLIVWQKARALNKAISIATRPAAFAQDIDLKRQIRRAAASIPSNIAEGFERGTSAEFSQFLSIAKGSCGEVRSHLYLALDTEILPQAQFDALLPMSEEVSRLLAGLRNAIKNKTNPRKTR